MKTILLAVDPDGSSDAARATAIRLAEALGATLDVITVGDYLFDSDVEPLEEAVADAAGEAMAAGVDANPELRYGDPAAEIAVRAKEIDADLIVVGAHHHGMVGRLVKGEPMSQEVARRARRPVLLVPEDVERV